MSVPVWVEQQNGAFTATVLGAPELRAEGKTKEAAVAAVRARVAERSSAGELVFVDVEPKVFASLGRALRDRSNLARDVGGSRRRGVPIPRRTEGPRVPRMTTFDTDVVSDLFVNSPAVVARIATVPATDQFVPIVVAEETL
jgi:hypothetical protein